MSPSPPVQARLDTDARPLVDTTFVVLDLETTGLRAGSDRITEVGAVKVRGGEVLGELQTLVRPGVPVPPAVTALTGLSDAMLEQAPPLASVLPTLLEFLRGAVFVAHNARFDAGFLDAELARHGYPRLGLDVVDTARLARRLVATETRDLRLATLARFFRSRTVPAHRALMDARATVDVLHGLLERAGTIGTTTVEDLLDLQRSSSQAAFRKIDLVSDAPSSPGVYRFHDREDRVLYVGTSGDLRRRLRRYFGQDDRRHIAAMVREAERVSWTGTATTVEANVLELRELAVRTPRYNRASVRPRRDAWLRWVEEPFPRFSVARVPPPEGAPAIGPLPGQRVARALLEAVEEVVDVRRCTGTLRPSPDHPACILKELGRCAAPCDGTADATAYASDVRAAARLVEGDAAAVLRALEGRMLEHARAARFEEAARIRERRDTLSTTLDSLRRRTALRALDRIEAARVGERHVDAVRVEHGRLVASTRVAVPRAARVPRDARATALEDATATLASLTSTPAPSPDGANARAEADLLARWLDGEGVVLLAIDGTWTSPVAAAAAACAAAEAAVTARTTRRDRQRLRDAGERRARSA